MDAKYVGVRLITNVLFSVRCPYCQAQISIRKVRRITKQATEINYMINGCEHFIAYYPSVRTAMFAI